ncbi:hypothetical protein S7711_03388 [Stachybotrys chartarum IBT 7711]|uniref:Nephrocystin 3-like N-terminal domain-containing protein n=1 Tax=Stachybotrys chartarum (strain CBS 109288 / IBT 7711) TaxID=1280523 RepID=A0A084AXY7_STACB|nr:hypothetical protein S7711_03388 [Stachybotrys chartarum IBT 7711]
MPETTGFASLALIAIRVTELSNSHGSGMRPKHATHRQYLDELSGLEDTLRCGEAAPSIVGSLDAALGRPAGLSTLQDAYHQLEALRTELEKPRPRLFSSGEEATLQQHVENLRRLRQAFAELLSATSTTHRAWTDETRQTQKQLLEWLGDPCDTSGPMPTPSPGVKDWLLHSQPYQSWASGQSDSPLLWCHGHDGVGKSVFASTAFHDFLTTFSKDDSVCVLRYFGDPANTKFQTKESIWRSLVLQAVTRGPKKVLQTLLKCRGTVSRGFAACTQELGGALSKVCSVVQVILVMDGLDEFESGNVFRTPLEPFLKTKSRILATTRSLPKDCLELNGDVLEVEMNKADLRTYVTNQFRINRLGEALEECPELVEGCIDKARGNFLLGKLIVSHLLDSSTVAEGMRQALEASPADLDQAVELILNSIDAQSNPRRTLARRVLGWLTLAKRRLLLMELIHGLAVAGGPDVIDKADLVTLYMILEACKGLVTANAENGTVGLIHSSVLSYIKERDDCSKDMAESCLTCLALRPLQTGPVDSASQMDDRAAKLPFLCYAAEYWVMHASQQASELGHLIDTVLNNPALRGAAVQAACHNNYPCGLAVRAASFNAPIRQTPLDAVSFWGLAERIPTLLDAGADVNAVDSQGWTPLRWACFGGDAATVSLLLDRGAGIEAKDSVGWTPLLWASAGGNDAVVELLLRHKADYFAQDVRGWTPLRWAAAQHKTRTMATMLRHHVRLSDEARNPVKTNIKDLSIPYARRFFDTTGLLAQHQIYWHTNRDDTQEQTAAAQIKIDPESPECTELFTDLLRDSFDIATLWPTGDLDAPFGNTWHPFTRPGDFTSITQHHLPHPRSHFPDQRPSLWRSRLLHLAIRDDNFPAAKLLVKLGADVNYNSAEPTRAATALHTAAFRTDPRFAAFLVDFGADLEARDWYCLTPLQLAVLNGFERTAEALLDGGADVNAVYTADEDTRVSAEARTKTPLMLACGLFKTCPAWKDMVRMLVRHGADVNAREAGPHGMTALHHMAQTRSPDMLRYLLDAGADPCVLDRHGRNAVHHLILGRDLSPARHLVLGKGQGPRFQPGQGVYVPVPDAAAAACLDMLMQACGAAVISQKAEWQHVCRTSRALYIPMPSTHTPLSLAVLHADWEFFQALHAKGAIFETNTPLGWTLYGAAEHRCVDAVDVLIAHGAAWPSDSPDPNLLLEHTATDEDIAKLETIARKITQCGYDVNAKSNVGQTPLLRALTQGMSKTPVQAVLELGGDVTVQGNNGQDALLVACSHGKTNQLLCLLEHVRGHPVEGHWTQMLEHQGIHDEDSAHDAVCAALAAKGVINSVTASGTLLCQAARAGGAVFIQHLVRHGAEPTLADSHGRRPLHLAASMGRTAAAQALLSLASTNVNAQDKEQLTPLHMACLHGQTVMTSLLLSAGAAVDANDGYGWKPLHYAIHFHHAACATALIAAGASVTAATARLCHAADRQRPSGFVGSQKWAATPLHLAAMAGNLSLVRLLLSRHGVDVAARADAFASKCAWDKPPFPGAGPTALHMVLDTGKFYGARGEELGRDRLEIAKLLVDKGASVEGVADHLQFKHLHKFEEHAELWDMLRAGITEESSRYQVLGE